MNRFMKKILVAVTAAMIGLTTVSTVYANDGMGISTMNVTIQDMDQDMVVTSEKANVREAPNTDSRVLHTLTRGTKIHVDGKVSNGWYRIWTTDPVYSGQTAGYISGNLLGAASVRNTNTAANTNTANTNAAANIPGVCHVIPRPAPQVSAPRQQASAQETQNAVIPGVSHVRPRTNV